MQSNILLDVFLPASLFIIMLGMGMSLTLLDFKRVINFPKATILGLTNQLIVLPLVAFGLCHIFHLPDELAIGLILISACPGGVTSNLISHLSNGDTALSISLTAISSLLTLITIPLYMGFAFVYFSKSGKVVDVDEVGMLLQVLVIVIIPVGIGMLVRYKNEKFAIRTDKFVRIFSIVFFVAILASIIIKEKTMIAANFPKIGTVTVALNLLTLGLGFFSAKLLSLNKQQAITIAIESGIQNGTLAIVIATTVLGNFSLSIPAGIYSLIMFVSAGFIMYFFGRKGNRSAN